MNENDIDVSFVSDEKSNDLSNVTPFISNNQKLDLSTKFDEARLNKVFTDTSFSKKMDVVKENVLAEAAVNDEHFVKTVQEEVKEAAKTSAKTETKKEKLKEKQVDTETIKEEREQKKVEHGVNEDKWDNIEKRRKVWYNGVKPIMKFVNIEEPMSIPITVFLTFILIVPFLIDKLWKGTIGALIFGACDENRPKSIKGLCWTILGLTCVLALSAAIYLFLQWQGII